MSRYCDSKTNSRLMRYGWPVLTHLADVYLVLLEISLPGPCTM